MPAIPFKVRHRYEAMGIGSRRPNWNLGGGWSGLTARDREWVGGEALVAPARAKSEAPGPDVIVGAGETLSDWGLPLPRLGPDQKGARCDREGIRTGTGASRSGSIMPVFWLHHDPALFFQPSGG
jgi:hypothetical protein